MAASILPAPTTTPAPVVVSTKRPVPPQRVVANVLFGVVAVVVFVCSVFPVYWMVSSSFLPTNLVRATVPTFFPGSDFTVDNYVRAVTDDTRADFVPALQTSLTVTFLTLVAALVIAFLASVAIGRYRFRGRKQFIVAILVVQMIPGEAMLLTYFQLIDGWGMLNMVLGLTILYVAMVLPFTVWTLRGFVTAVPVELEEAAMIDGCSRTRAFWKVTFPLLAPGLVSTGVFAFIQAWNEFVLALVIMSRPESMTLPVWLRTFQQATKATDYGALMAGSVLVAIPVIIFFLFVQGRMTGGLVSGAVKG
ncbi:carbohydrate ABC transporter membrane protein 2 (CUT1 family) [Isoptericola sp. CG 20/1183]|uniref:Carbohydrate ABC transporter membrane protein 2 (CUT1 family) n=1 Tax=Isoptericola halotolerans TaxID=300560 RepID=A0ABX5EHE0_9MICO|nr:MULTISPECIES: carbohydrate ABC transporter permease [Isoptericola]PRZ07660.1 carbohydrate ABC transporter membrane protein 2 (CUT1 family) [Isoptericola halotolerans]PRZ07981.1 carbohydrate ABC transporter membrane protein 2 (CUT1 family) [Isoptericola sp. CG 20/1183]